MSVLLDVPRGQLERISSRLAQSAGLQSLELAAEVVAFSYVAVGAALEVALKTSVAEALEHLRGAPRSSLSAIQVAAVSESSFEAFVRSEAARSRHAVKRAIDSRVGLVTELLGTTMRGDAPSVIQMSGVPHSEHFNLFFRLTTSGQDPRGAGAIPPLAQLVGRVNQIRGPRRDFAHDCADPTEHQLVVGRLLQLSGLPDAVKGLQVAVSELVLLLDVLESACAQLKTTLIAPAA